MQKDKIDQGSSHGTTEFDDELRDVLIAISVVAKGLAKKIEQKQMPKEGDKQNE